MENMQNIVLLGTDNALITFKRGKDHAALEIEFRQYIYIYILTIIAHVPCQARTRLVYV